MSWAQLFLRAARFFGESSVSAVDFELSLRNLRLGRPPGGRRERFRVKRRRWLAVWPRWLPTDKNPREIVANDLIPDIKQKGVDIRIGMDIASLAVKRIVDTLVLVTGDSDFVPAMKFARKEGLRVYLETLGHGVRRQLKVHADYVL